MEQFKQRRRKVSFWVMESELELLTKTYKTNSVSTMFTKLIEDKLQHDFGGKDATRSPITAIGGKNKLAKKIIDMMPQHDIYVEPFCNTASILFRKDRSKKEIINDIDGELVNFFQVLQKDPIGLYSSCISIPYSEQVHRKMLSDPIPSDEVERAVRFFFLSRTSFLGANTTGFRTNSADSRNYSKLFYSECERFYAIASRLRGVEILNRDYKKIVNKYKDNSNTLILADPPYYDGTEYYTNNFKLKDHCQLARALAEIKGKAIVLHSKNYQIHKLYVGLGFNYTVIRTKYATRKTVESDEGKSKPIVPLHVYTNYVIDK